MKKKIVEIQVNFQEGNLIKGTAILPATKVHFIYDLLNDRLTTNKTKNDLRIKYSEWEWLVYNVDMMGFNYRFEQQIV